ncbi:MAG TPA: winged helix-turn-helix domain-containing protein, partial [Solirubrobacteraceae bacterium]|nr:winged helix-turn-helix domain-containing protein [Solirubrobacteraceae bacterium]
MTVSFGVLGPIVGTDAGGRPLALGGPRHRAIVARLLVARGEQVTLDRLIDDLWGEEAPAGAAGAIRTFVGDLRRVLEPGRPPRAPAALLTTEGRGYALRAALDAVDA